MDWNPTTKKNMTDSLEAVVPETFRAIALDGLETDAAKFARERSAEQVENQDVIKALALAPDFIQEALLTTFKARSH